MGGKRGWKQWINTIHTVLGSVFGVLDNSPPSTPTNADYPTQFSPSRIPDYDDDLLPLVPSGAANQSTTVSSLPQAFKLTGDAGPCTTKPVISHASAIAPFQLALSFSLPQALRLMGDAETIGIYVVASASTRRPFTAALLFLRTCSGVKKSYYTCMNLLLPRHYVIMPSTPCVLGQQGAMKC